MSIRRPGLVGRGGRATDARAAGTERRRAQSLLSYVPGLPPQPLFPPPFSLSLFDHPGPQRVGLRVPQESEQVVVLLDDRALEPALPDVAAGAGAVVVPGVGHGE